MSYSYVDKSRRKVAQNIATSTKEVWKPPRILSLHWDSKLLPMLNNPNVSEERLTVIVGTQHETKLLGTPAYPPQSVGNRQVGGKVADFIMQLLQSWNCASSIVNMVFDTTASNTGHLTAACVCMQQQLGHALLWSGCRHHIGEVILSQIFKDLEIEASKSPAVSVFLRFRKHFSSLDTSIQLMDISSSDLGSKTAHAIEQLKEYSLSVLQSDFIPARDDYHELIQLCTKFLGGNITLNFRRPGALHKARWMAKLLYSFKICLLESAINRLSPSTIATTTQLRKLRQFINFSALVYCPWWFLSSSAVDAPCNDLKLFKSILLYADVDELVSSSAMSALQRHLWYLTPEMIPLFLFSSELSNTEKEEIVQQLLLHRPLKPLMCPSSRYGTGFGKPGFTTWLTSTTSLSELITEDSWFFFEIIKIDATFLLENAANWPSANSYQRGLQNVDALNVVNDCAERGVKQCADFLPCAHSEDHFQNVLQVVENDRRQIPDIRKSST